MCDHLHGFTWLKLARAARTNNTPTARHFGGGGASAAVAIAASDAARVIRSFPAARRAFFFGAHCRCPTAPRANGSISADRMRILMATAAAPPPPDDTSRRRRQLCRSAAVGSAGAASAAGNDNDNTGSAAAPIRMHRRRCTLATCRRRGAGANLARAQIAARLDAQRRIVCAAHRRRQF